MPEDALARENGQLRIDWFRVSPFILMHCVCVAAFFIPVSKFDIALALFFYWARLFSIGAFYHRYFSHKTYKMGRALQFICAFIANSSAQRGPLWWAAHHRDHHKYSDSDLDPHSPINSGFLWSHMLWFMTYKHYQYDKTRVQDWLKYPELRFIDRFDFIAPLFLLLSLFVLGELLSIYVPAFHTTGLQCVVWGFCVSTVVLFHSTVSINSFSHLFGRRRFKTKDNSRNNFLLALLTFGEGWHNNHHHYPNTVRQGFYWWEIDITYYLLKCMQCFHLVRELKELPKHVKLKG